MGEFVENQAVTQSLKDLAAWYQRPFGCNLKTQITHGLSEMLSELTLREALCLGVTGAPEFLSSKEHKWATFYSHLECSDWLAGEDDCLPLRPQSQECVVLLHGLDLAVNPHALLRELGRIVTDDGYVIIIGFNPISPAGLYRPLRKLLKWWPHKMPWPLQFYRIGRLTDWLELLSFNVCAMRTMTATPHVNRKGLQKTFSVLDKLYLTLFPNCGNVYMLLAKKRTLPVTPVKMQWKAPTGLLKPGFPKTTAGRG